MPQGTNTLRQWEFSTHRPLPFLYNHFLSFIFFTMLNCLSASIPILSIRRNKKKSRIILCESINYVTQVEMNAIVKNKNDEKKMYIVWKYCGRSQLRTEPEQVVHVHIVHSYTHSYTRKGGDLWYFCDIWLLYFWQKAKIDNRTKHEIESKWTKCIRIISLLLIEMLYISAFDLNANSNSEISVYIHFIDKKWGIRFANISWFPSGI